MFKGLCTFTFLILLTGLNHAQAGGKFKDQSAKLYKELTRLPEVQQKLKLGEKHGLRTVSKVVGLSAQSLVKLSALGYQLGQRKISSQLLENHRSRSTLKVLPIIDYHFDGRLSSALMLTLTF